MELSTAKQILSLLADGIDPETGEILPKDSVCNQPEVIRALHFALDCLSHQKQRRMTSNFLCESGQSVDGGRRIPADSSVPKGRIQCADSDGIAAFGKRRIGAAGTAGADRASGGLPRTGQKTF